MNLNTYSSSLGSVQAISTGVSLQGERKKFGNQNTIIYKLR